MRGLAVEWITTRGRAARLGEEWNALLDRSRSSSVFLRHEWLEAWWDHVATDCALWIASVRDPAGRLVGIGPFCLRTRGSVLVARTLEFLGTSRISSEYLDIIAEPGLEGDVAAAIWRGISGQVGVWDWAAFSDAPESSVLLNELRMWIAPDDYGLRTEVSEECPYLLLPSSSEILLGGLRRHFRGALKRGERHIERLGGEIGISQDPGTLPAALQTLFDLHQRRWALRSQSGKLRHPSVRRFHEQVAARMPSGMVRIHTLRIHGRPVAALYALEYKGRLFYYQSGFDPARPDSSIGRGEYSPGLWVIHAAIRDAIARGLQEFDTLRGVEAYKRRWTSDSRRTWRLIILPPAMWRGVTYDRIERKIRDVKRSVRSLLPPRRESGSDGRAA